MVGVQKIAEVVEWVMKTAGLQERLSTDLSMVQQMRGGVYLNKEAFATLPDPVTFFKSRTC